MARSRLGKYRLLRHLATGGMGEVFLARQEGPARFSKTVVIKRLLRHLASDGSFVEMFQTEARLAALVSHPNVVQIFELGEDDGTHFIAMEWVRGVSLREVMRAAKDRDVRIPVSLAIHVVAQFLHGLAAAHALVRDDGRPLGVVHRDVTPENVLVSFDGPVKLVDFGIAKAASLTAVGRTTLRGKYAYLAPEQYRSEPIDGRTDIFAAGVVLYELLSGQRPFVAENEAAVVDAILTAEPTPLLELDIGVTAGISAAVDQALAKDPADRFPNAEAMAIELEACLLERGERVSSASVRTFMHELFGARASSVETNLGEPVPAATEALDRVGVSPRRTAAIAAAAISMIVASVSVGLWATGKRASLPSPVPLSTAADVPVASVPHSEAPPDAIPSASATGTTNEPSFAHAVPSSGRSHPDRRPAGRSSASSPAPANGTLSLRIRPWAEVFVDGRSIGVSPLPPIELPAGRHVLVLRNRDLAAERKVVADVVPGATANVRVDLFE